ncbi:hypothetical protein HJG60_008271 [Phyllostomus discolor]|uniref:ADP-ribosylation factor-like protein 2-binding protein n=1 Tax=Phyllostomus discolor TaxID=89673 RepID=A0A834DPC8_9CHIR|nr:hypothetical protein HJG60_008271 [Phyllostomus discolor]
MSWTSSTRSLKTKENKLTCMPIFNKHISLVEKYIKEQLLGWIPGFNMAGFTTPSQHHKDEGAADIFDMLLTFTDFLAFKEIFLDYRAEKEGLEQDLSSVLVVTLLCKLFCGTRPHLQALRLSGCQQLSLLGEASANDRKVDLGETSSVLQLFINVKY